MKTAIALGTFDGVHIAHRFVLDLPKQYKKVAVTFAAPPKMVFEKSFELLMPLSKRVEIPMAYCYNNVLLLFWM